MDGPISNPGSAVTADTPYQGRDIRLLNPYISRANSYKGQLHCHTDNSDGADTPAQVETAYQAAGYNFCAITDHNVLTPDPGVANIQHVDGVEESGSESHVVSLFPTAQVASTATQDIIDEIIADNALPGIPHPDWAGKPCSKDRILTLENLRHLDIRNAQVGDAAADIAREQRWDDALTRNFTIWGITVDDNHDIGVLFNLFWVIVYADSLTVANLKDALRNGNFYCSSGHDFASISVSGFDLTVTFNDSTNVTFIGETGRTLQTNNGVVTATYTIQGNERYVRVRAVKVSDSSYCWSQPIFVLSLGGPPDNVQHKNEPLSIARVTTEQEDMPANGYYRAEITTIVVDKGNSFINSNWYGAAGAYRQADADSNANFIEDDDANFESHIQYAMVKWASNALGTLNTGLGYVSTWNNATKLTIVKQSGADFAASYYYWIVRSYFYVDIPGYYRLEAQFALTNIQADKVHYGAFFLGQQSFTGPAILNAHHSSNTNPIRFAMSGVAHFNEGDRIKLCLFTDSTTVHIQTNTWMTVSLISAD